MTQTRPVPVPLPSAGHPGPSSLSPCQSGGPERHAYAAISAQRRPPRACVGTRSRPPRPQASPGQGSRRAVWAWASLRVASVPGPTCAGGGLTLPPAVAPAPPSPEGLEGRPSVSTHLPGLEAQTLAGWRPRSQERLPVRAGLPSRPGHRGARWGGGGAWHVLRSREVVLVLQGGGSPVSPQPDQRPGGVGGGGPSQDAQDLGPEGGGGGDPARLPRGTAVCVHLISQVQSGGSFSPRGTFQD